MISGITLVFSIEIIDRSDNIRYDMTIKVRYELIPFREIRYEIVGGHMSGIKNRIQFSDAKNNPDYKSLIELALPILDIAGHPWAGKSSSVYQDLGLYLRMQDAMCMEGKEITRFMKGQVCLKCKKGKLDIIPGENTEIGNHTLRVEKFQCDWCQQVFKHYLSISRDRIGAK